MTPPPRALTLEKEVVHHKGDIWGNAELEKILVRSRLRQVATTRYHSLTG